MNSILFLIFCVLEDIKEKTEHGNLYNFIALCYRKNIFHNVIEVKIIILIYFCSPPEIKLTVNTNEKFNNRKKGNVQFGNNNCLIKI